MPAGQADNRSRPFRVKVWGERALFARPEHNPERFSYPAITPTAAVGVLESIFWKPEFRWEVEAIEILNPLRWGNRTFNGVQAIASRDPFLASGNRMQIHERFLKDVAYVITASIVLKEHANDPVAKYAAQMNRRLERGETFSAPYLGTRENTAYVSLADGTETPIDETFQIGPMPLRIDYETAHGPADGRTSVWFFNAYVENGRIEVPTDGEWKAKA